MALATSQLPKCFLINEKHLMYIFTNRSTSFSGTAVQIMTASQGDGLVMIISGPQLLGSVFTEKREGSKFE